MATRRELKVYVQRRGGYDRDALVETAVRTVVAKVFSTRLSNTLRITLQMRSTTLTKNRIGEAHWEVVANPASKHYKIVVDRDLPGPELVRVINHEVQHLHQFATGRLRFGKRGGVAGCFWRPSTGPAQFFPHASTDYWTSPWEVEARAAEGV